MNAAVCFCWWFLGVISTLAALACLVHVDAKRGEKRVAEYWRGRAATPPPPLEPTSLPGPVVVVRCHHCSCPRDRCCMCGHSKAAGAAAVAAKGGQTN